MDIGDIAVLAVALLALRVRQDRYRLSAERPRKGAAVALGVWGLANLWPAPVVIAIVVWQRDSLTMVAATLTATVYAVTWLSPEMAALISPAASAGLAMELETLLHAGAAGLLVAACARLALAARATWRLQ